MRRGIVLLSIGWGICWIVFILQFIQECNADIHINIEEITTAPAAEVVFPYIIAGTNLLVEGIGIYEGPFLEDGSDAPATNTAALLVRNLSDLTVERCGIILEIAGAYYVFEGYEIPPSQSVFIVEAGMKKYSAAPVTLCTGWSVEVERSGTAQFVVAEECGMETLKITNISNETLSTVRILYKSYDQGCGVFIGGVCHEVEVETLAAGQSIIIKPYRYACGYSKVVGIELLH